MNEREQTRKMTREMVEKVKAHLGGTLLMLDIGMEQTAVSLYQLCNLALDGLKGPEKVQLPPPHSYACVAPVRQISDNPKILDAEVLQALLSNPRTHKILKGMAHEIATQDVRATSHPMYCVRVKRAYHFESEEYDAGTVVWSDEDGNDAEGPLFRDLQEYFDTTSSSRCEVIFDDDGGYVRIYDGDVSEEHYTKLYTRYGTYEYFEVVTTFFTNKSAETYIEENRHNLRDPHVYVDSGYRNYEWQFMRALIVALGRSL
jgi:hypothetical protein